MATLAMKRTTPALLRPAKVRDATRRRWFEHDLARLPVSGRGALEDVGTPYGGWLVPTAVMGRGWTCWSIGAGRDISFDLELVRRWDARVWIVEPVAEFVARAQAETQGDPRIRVIRAALADVDGPVRMQVNSDPRSESVSSADLWTSDAHVELPGRSLPSLMDEHETASIDFFKLDVEGAEYELLAGMDLRSLGVKVFATQLHSTRSPHVAKALIRRLQNAGYELVGRREVVKLTFVRSDLL